MVKVLVPFKTVFNAYKEVPEDEQHESKNVNIKVFDFMVPLLEELSRKKPAWKFVSRRHGVVADGVWIHRTFEVIQDGEKLGTLTCESRHHGMSYVIHNSRLSERRRRGSGTATLDRKKAIKTILNAFYPTTHLEKMKDVGDYGAQLIRNQYSKRRMDFNAAVNALTGAAFQYLLDNPETLTQLKVLPAHEGFVRDLPKLREEERRFAETATCLGEGRAAVVLIDRDNYIVAPRDNLHNVSKFTTADLPPLIKEAVGLLKLMNDETVLPGVGARITDTSFIVTVEPVESPPATETIHESV